MLDNGYILLHRSILDWEWYGDANTARLFLHLLLTVNYEDRAWRGMVVKRGQRVCSYATLASETKLSIKNIRSSLNHLKATGEVAHETNPQYSMITVLNYDKYQQAANQTANKGQTRGKPAANKGQQLKKAKESKKDKEVNICAFDTFWKAYPKKRSKGDALKAWEKINPDRELIATMMNSLAKAKTCRDWTKDSGKYIPYPATWLNRMGWEDVLDIDQKEDDDECL